MRFSEWHSFDDLDMEVPEAGGLFQLRIRDGLLSYPSGKTAMFYYGYATNLEAGLRNFRLNILPALEVSEEALYVRWMAADDTEGRFRNHLNGFYSKFGTLPLGNEIWLHKQHG